MITGIGAQDLVISSVYEKLQSAEKRSKVGQFTPTYNNVPAGNVTPVVSKEKQTLNSGFGLAGNGCAGINVFTLTFSLAPIKSSQLTYETPIKNRHKTSDFPWAIPCKVITSFTSTSTGNIIAIDGWPVGTFNILPPNAVVEKSVGLDIQLNPPPIKAQSSLLEYPSLVLKLLANVATLIWLTLQLSSGIIGVIYICVLILR